MGKPELDGDIPNLDKVELDIEVTGAGTAANMFGVRASTANIRARAAMSLSRRRYILT